MPARALPPSPRFLGLLLLLASAAVVGGALLFQYAGGLAPCELCLYQRWPYYLAIVLILAILLLGRDAAMRRAIALCGVGFAAGTALAFYHVGVEQHWFAGPSACTGSIGGAQSVEALTAQLLARQPVNCDEPAWTMFGVSLAGLNLLASILLLGFCIAAVRRLAGRGGAA